MRLLVCGDRNWDSYEYLAEQLDIFSDDTFLIEGGAKGADTMALEYALWRGWDWVEFPANWSTFHRAAGPIRNQQMLDEGKPDRVLAFHNNFAKSKGTADMVRRAEKAKISVHLWHEL